MTWTATLFRSAQVILVALLLGGCVPAGQTQADEEKEPHFLAGKKRVSTLDNSGAIECFEKALEVNPRSGAAHFELACLYEETDPATAIYHYQSYLKVRPEAGNAEVVKQRIMTCKQELARNVSLGPLTQRQQLEFEQQAEENKRLIGEVKRLKDELDQWQRAYAARLGGTTNPQSSAAQSSHPPAPVPGGSTSINTGSPTLSLASAAPVTKTHTVKAGENATVIARKYGIKVDALLAANPRVDSRRLKIGQTLVIPVP
jgi:LysM repeat protein